MVNVLARSPGNLIEVIVSQDYLFDEFYSLKQILEVMFGNAGIRSGSATVVFELTSIGSKARRSKIQEFSKCLS